ncbi:hypothetical protein MED92_16685 [Oceanospirillum sp. MED92]|uniref:Sulfotransferase family protein n=2 Tax=Neptuniibacter caesariensis TaxID=207954 RepID=A0A7U8C569_NEPCE|nr:hypothetical protein MED92_16685 [Oceanospirillum sp. MED92] [Neptuniibacter caesariensis]
MESQEAGLRDHSSVAEIKGYLGEDFEEYNGLSIVRNPYHRCLSYYNHIKRSNSWLYQEFSKFGDISSVSKFVALLPEIIIDFENNKWGDKSIWPQTKWLEIDGSVVTKTIIKLEEYDESVNTLSEFFGREISTAVVKNARPKIHNLLSPYEKQLGVEERSAIFDIYKSDFETFGYSK